MGKSLYHITEEQRALNLLLEESGGEMTPELEQALTINEGNFLAKSESYVYAIKDYDAWEERIAAEIQRLTQMKRVATNAKNRLKQTLIVAMQQFGYDKVTYDLHSLSLRKTTAVNVIDEAAVPKEYFKVELTLDKKRLKDDLKQAAIPGAELSEGYYIQIR